jgi:signal transduction histidine kinase
MDRRWLWARSPLLIAGFGTALFLTAVAHHASELAALDGVTGPLVAFLLDGTPALGVVYAGYRLSRADLSPDDRWAVSVWCLAGGVLIGAVMGPTLLVRAFEGRSVAEPLFPLLVATEAGAIAGAVAGYYNARARADARRAETVSNAFAFVNQLIRHDLRNDLNVIYGHADVIATETGSDGASIIVEQTDEALARIETTGAIAETLIGEPDLERIDLVAVTTEMAASVEDAFPVTVTADLPDRATVTANAGLRSVVDNLLENAAEHNDADDPRIHVAIESGTEAVTLSVRDNGPGIPDERKETIFDAGDGRPRDAGLSIVRTLVEGYGGDVWVEDNEPRGSVFVVELPRANGGDR